MESILEAINEWIKEILIGAINGNLSTMFGDVNEKVGTIAAEGLETLASKYVRGGNRRPEKISRTDRSAGGSG